MRGIAAGIARCMRGACVLTLPPSAAVEYLPIEASVGDTLIFNYVPRQHGVALLPTRQAFEKCNKAVAKVLAPPDAVAGAPTGPPFRYTIKQADLDAPGGVLFFGCPVANHCATGQKVEVIVRPMGAMAPAPAPGPAASMTRPLAAAPAAA